MQVRNTNTICGKRYVFLGRFILSTGFDGGRLRDGSYGDLSRRSRPLVKDGDTTVPKEDKTKHSGGGGGGDDYGDLDPLIAGLLRRMPKAGEAWPVAERARWLQTLAMNLSFIHADKPSDSTIDVTVKSATVPPPPPSQLNVQDVMS